MAEWLRRNLPACIENLPIVPILGMRLPPGEDIGRRLGNERNELKNQAEIAKKQMNLPADRAYGVALGNVALQLGTRELFFGKYEVMQLKQLSTMRIKDVQRILRESLTPTRRFTTTLLP